MSQDSVTLLDFEFGILQAAEPVPDSLKRVSVLADPESYGVTIDYRQSPISSKAAQ